MPIQLIDNFRFTQDPASRGDCSTGSKRSAEAEVLASRLYLSDGGAFLITGYRGVGKTTFVHDVVRRLKDFLHEQPPDQDGGPILLDVCLNIARPISGVELMHLMLRQLHNRLVDMKILSRLPKPLRSQLRLAFLRTSAMLSVNTSSETERALSFEKWLAVSGKVTSGTSRDISYLAYDERSAENDLIALARQLVRGVKPGGLFSAFASPMRFKLLFVLDELDKIDDSDGNESALTDILKSLKTLFTTSGISFIFVAGRSLHERWLQDVRRGDSIYESVFSESRYLPAAWDQVDEICDPLLAGRERLSEYDRMLYQDFKRFLAYDGRGIPRRILRAFHQRVHWDGQQILLHLSERDRRQMRFHAELYHLLSNEENAICGDHSRDLRADWLDRQRLGLYYLLDWIMTRGMTAFSLPELIDVAFNQLQPGIAPTRELAPKVVANLLRVLADHDYLETVIEPDDPDQDAPPAATSQEWYRVPERRLIEMGRYSESPQPSMEAGPESVFADRYQVVELLGRGASSEVYRAVDLRLGHMVALKYFHSDYAPPHSQSQKRLEEEIAVHKKLSHPGVAKLLDYTIEGERPVIVMEYVEGLTLRRLLKNRQRLDYADARAIVSALLDTLQYLHAEGVIWRDVKPANIVITPKGRVVIMDFGIAQTDSSAQYGPDTTRIGFAAGTPAYMSPEHVRGEKQQPASDLFSVGTLLYEMLTGEKPWVGDNPLEILAGITGRPVTQLPGFQRLPAGVQTLLAKAMDSEIARRYQSAAQMLGELPPGDREAELGALVGDARPTQQEAPATPAEVTQLGPVSLDMEAPSAPAPSSAAWDVFDDPGPPPGPNPAREGKMQRDKHAVASRRQTVVEIEDPSNITIPRSYALLTIVDGPEDQYLALFGEEISLGRSPECDIQLSDTACSRFHAAIVADADGHLIKDLNSQNGVYVNQERIYEQRKLRDGDQLTLGETLLKYQSAQTAGIKSASGD